MPNIDDLSIGIKSNVTSATNSIDKLITKLGALSASLGQVNTSGFGAMASGIRQITSATNGLGGNSAKNLTELSLALRKFGSKTANQATANIPKLSNSIGQLVMSMNSISGMNMNTDSLTSISTALSRLGGIKVSAAVTNIPQLSTALQGMVASVNQLGAVSGSITSLGQLANSLSRLGGKTVTNAITNIPQLTNSLMQMMATLSKAPQVSYNTIQLVNALSNLASQGNKVGTASNSLYNGFMRFGKGADYARGKSFSLASAIGKLYASYWLLFRAFRGIGKGITLASDLTEVQNVVDVTFGQYRDMLEDFATTSIQDFGMSELTAKQIASRYQAMGSAIGFAQGEMADMSIELTKLAADMASFYNVEQSAVAEDLAAIFTGQTRPLRAYGLDLTQATLQEWALSQGMEANIATMTQAEKVLLRYNYVLSQTGAAQGDFARTQGTWANQIRILRQQFEALGAIIGQNFVYALKPVITALNTVMAKLIQFARVVSNSLGKIFGWKYEDSTGGIVDDLEYGADYAEDLGSGLGGAADNAKKLKQQLQGFDELNVLTTNQGGSGGGGGGGSLGDDVATGETGQWVKDNGLFDFESDLDSLYKLGDYIGTTLTNTLRSIDWDSVYEGARNFGSGLASFLNGLISPELFSATGATIAGALNIAIYSSLAFGETFDFEEFGLSIAEGINTFFTDTDFSALGESIRTWVIGLKNTIITIIKEIEWGDILSGIGDVLGALDAETIAILFGFKALSILFKGGLFSWLSSSLASTTVLPTELQKSLNMIGLKIRLGFVGGLGSAFVGFKLGEWIYEKITGDETSDINYLDYFLGDSKASAKEWWGAVKEYIKNDIISIEEGSLADALLMSVQGKSAKEISSKRNGEPTQKIKQFSKDISKYFGSSSKSVESFTDKYSVYMNNIKKDTQKSYETIKDNTTNAFSYIKELIIGESETASKDMANSYIEASQSIRASTSDTTSDIAAKYVAMRNNVESTTNAMKNTVNSNSNSIKITSADTTSDIAAKYKAMGLGVAAETTAMKNSVNSNSNSIKITSADTTSDIVAKYKAMRQSNETEVTNLKSKAVSMLSAIKTDGVKATDGLNTNLKSKFEDARLGANASFVGMHNIVVSNMNSSKNVIANQSWYSAGTNLVNGLSGGISDQWGGSLVSKIISLAQSLTSKLKAAFGIHSPSRIWQDDIGYYLTEGLRLGIVGEENNLINSVVGMGNRLTDSFSNSLTLATPKSIMNDGYDFGVTSTMAHQYSADSSMSSNIAQGVRDGVTSAQAEQNALLRQQNELLMQILDKTGISSSDLFSAVRRESRQHYNQTGTNAFVF